METNTTLIGTAVRILRNLGICLLGGVLTSFFFDALGTLLMLRDVLAWHDWLPGKAVLGFSLAVYHRWVLRTLRRHIRRIWDMLLDLIHFVAGEQLPSDCIDGIPRTELLDFLFREKSFKQQDVLTEFKIPRYRVTDLKQHLERVGILQRGECNAHVLNPEYSRQDIARMLDGVQTAADLQPLFRKREDGSFTSDPSAKEIERRVTSLLSAETVGFQRELVSA